MYLCATSIMIKLFIKNMTHKNNTFKYFHNISIKHKITSVQLNNVRTPLPANFSIRINIFLKKPFILYLQFFVYYISNIVPKLEFYLCFNCLYRLKLKISKIYKYGYFKFVEKLTHIALQ